MNTPSSHLFDLVKTLTKSEKRYIKVQFGSRGKDYMRLLDALIAQDTFDERQLIKENQGENFLKHLAVNKRYLYDLLLKSLANFGQKVLTDKIFERISATNVLIEKGLHLAASGELKKGLKIAEEYELFGMQIILFDIKKRLLSSQQFKAKDVFSSQEIFDAEMNSLEQLKNTNEYWYLAQQIAEFQMRFQKIQNEEQQSHIESFTETPKFQNQSLATNFKSKVYFYQANASYQFMLGKVEQAYKINKSFLDLLEENPRFFRLYAERYLATLNNMLIDSLVIGKYDILEEGINRLVMIPDRPEFKSIKNIESRIFRQRFLLLINWSLSQKDFEKAKDWIPDIENGLERFGKKIEKHHRITFYYLIAYLFFQNSEFPDALKWSNKILNDSKEDVVKEIFYFARILNLLIHFELGNYDLLESLLSSTPKYLKRRRAIYSTEKALFRFLGKMVNTVDKKEKKKLQTDFEKEIQDLAQQASEKRVFNYLDLRLWIDNNES